MSVIMIGSATVKNGFEEIACQFMVSAFSVARWHYAPSPTMKRGPTSTYDLDPQTKDDFGRSTRLPEERSGRTHTRRRPAGAAHRVAEDRPAAQCQGGLRSHGARSAPRPHHHHPQDETF